MAKITLLIASSALLVLCGVGCALLKDQSKLPTAVEHSVEVLMCARQVSAMVEANGRDLLPGAALAFCEAFERSPKILPAGEPS